MHGENITMTPAEYSSIPDDIESRTIADEEGNHGGVYSWGQATGERRKARYMMLVCYVLAIGMIAQLILKRLVVILDGSLFYVTVTFSFLLVYGTSKKKVVFFPLKLKA